MGELFTALIEIRAFTAVDNMLAFILQYGLYAYPAEQSAITSVNLKGVLK
jgi:hypothetical protein